MKCSETLNDYGGRRQKKRFCIYLREDCLLIEQKEEQTKPQKSGKKLYKKIEGKTNRAKVLKRRKLYKKIGRGAEMKMAWAQKYFKAFHVAGPEVGQGDRRDEPAFR